MNAEVSTDPRDDPRLGEFRSLPLSMKVRALDDLVTELRGWADRWDAEGQLRRGDDDLTDVVAGCLYAISEGGRNG